VSTSCLHRLKRRLEGNVYESAPHRQRIKRDGSGRATGHGGISVYPKCNHDDKLALEHLLLVDHGDGRLSRLVADQACWTATKGSVDDPPPDEVVTVDSGKASNTYSTYGSKQWRLLRVL